MNNKPLVQMTTKELQKTFDAIGLGNTFRMLEDARRAENENVLIAVAILILPDGTERFGFFGCEYGDGEETRIVQDWIDEVQRSPGLLRKGERLEFRLIDLTAAAHHWSAGKSGESKRGEKP